MKAEKKSANSDILLKKKELMLMRIKLSAGEQVDIKKMRLLKKEIARIYTVINANKSK